MVLKFPRNNKNWKYTYTPTTAAPITIDEVQIEHLTHKTRQALGKAKRGKGKKELEKLQREWIIIQSGLEAVSKRKLYEKNKHLKHIIGRVKIARRNIEKALDQLD